MTEMDANRRGTGNEATRYCRPTQNSDWVSGEHVRQAGERHARLPVTVTVTVVNGSVRAGTRVKRDSTGTPQSRIG
jgi:hypothetical protein